MELRRPPPPFRRVKVLHTHRVSARMCRVTLSGQELDGFHVEQPAASVRLLLPQVGGELVLPDWAGNEFLLPGRRRPVIRTLTPRRVDPINLELDVEVVIHGAGLASDWAKSTQPGDDAAVSGPARGYSVDLDSPRFFLAGDETALPAIGQLLEHLPPDRPAEAVIEIASPDARTEIPARPGLTVKWLDLPRGAPPGQALVGEVVAADLGPQTRVWVAGEAAAVQRIRRHLFEVRAFPRAQASVRGYWKHGRRGDPSDE